MTDSATAVAGDNLPPAGVDPLHERLHTEHAPLIKESALLLELLERQPKEITDEEQAGRMADLIQTQVNGFLKSANAVFEEEKAPFLAAGRTCDNFKHTLIDKVEAAKVTVNAVRKVWADKKAAEEKIRREEEARKAREEAREKQRIADEEAAERRREQEERQRKIDEEAAERKRIADEAQAKADAEAKAMKDEDDLKKAQIAQAEADRIAAENEAKDRALQAEADRQEKADLAAQKKTDAEATRADKVAVRAEKATGAKAAELGKSRGEYGGQTSLKTVWLFTDLDRNALDLESLRDHIPMDALEQAINSWIKANVEPLQNGETLRGVRIYSDTKL